MIQLIGTPNKIEKIQIKANGKSIATAVIDLAVGEMATCSFNIPLEDHNSYQPGQVVTINASSSGSGSGVLFKGMVIGKGFNNSVGQISCRIDLIHEIAKKLDSASCLFPGHMPGSMHDNEAFIKDTSSGSVKNMKKTMLFHVDSTQDLGNAICLFMAEYSYSASQKDSHEYKGPDQEELQKAIQASQQIESFTGIIKNQNEIWEQIDSVVNEQMKSGTSSSTYWNMMSSILSEFNCVLVCKADGSLLILPDLSGTKSQGHAIDPGQIASFSQSGKYDRTPTEIFVRNADTQSAVSNGLISEHTKVQYYKIPEKERPAHASGSLTVMQPRFLRDATLAEDNDIKKQGEWGQAYAKVVAARTTGYSLMATLVCPLAISVYPGVVVTFDHLSKVKSFSNGAIPGLDGEFSGYCSGIRHSIGTESAPTTTFSFTHVTKEGEGGFTKAPGHYYFQKAPAPPPW